MSHQIRLSHLAGGRRWQARFLLVLPDIQHYACRRFRNLRQEAREEAIAATIARAFVDFGVLARQHKLNRVYPGRLANLAVRRVCAGRLVGRPQNTRDLFNRKPYRLQSVHPWDAGEGTWREQAVPDRRTTPGDMAAFNLDFERWLNRWPWRHRRIINALAAGNRDCEVAGRFRMDRSRVSQCRRMYRQSWEQFQGLARAA
jgi:hypothetical protein